MSSTPRQVGARYADLLLPWLQCAATSTTTARKGSGTSRRVRRRRLSGTDISLPPKRTERLVLFPRGGKCGRATDSGGLTPGSAFCPCPHHLLLFLGSPRRTGGLAAYLRVSSIRTWSGRTLPTTPCGRCFATICGACHFTSLWPDHPHPPSHLRSGTRSISVGSRSPV